MSTHDAPHSAQSGRQLLALSITALGVVYGDIGTSPLYALKECFSGEHGVARTEANIFGILSLVVWSLMLVIVVKYLSFIMRADNRGAGGILALLALISGRTETPKRTLTLIFLGLFGAALLYGDGIITPAISVLSAVEGLSVATHALDRFVVPVTCGILILLFWVQKRGTARVGMVFGPITLVWFVAIAAIGVRWIAREPRILSALSPHYAVLFFLHNKWHGFLVLGAVVLCVTGGEALYADMGHFGKRPIRVAWYAVVMPALLLNYFGQGVLLLQRGDAVVHPFYELISGWMLYPLVIVATIAASVASQALISGAYSLTQQAVQLGYFPRVAIIHTSGEAEGQIYVPEINNMLMVACIALVLAFPASTKLAAAYGIAVTGTMAITSVLFYAVAVTRWKWGRPKALALLALFLMVDLAFFGANVLKIAHGGWFPIAVAAIVFTVMTTWKRGRSSLGVYMRSVTLPLETFMEDVARSKPTRVEGTAVFMTSNSGGAPPVLLHHFKHNKTLHEQIVFLSVITRDEPHVDHEERVSIKELGDGFWQVSAFYGFMESPSVVDILAACREHGLETKVDDTSFFLGRETLLTTGKSGMARWRKALFSFLSRNARPATHFFAIPPNRVIELGIQVEL
jgi:KUP system potassium uptake protein